MATTDPAERIERLLAGAERRFREEFLAVVSAIKSERSLADIARLLELGQIDEALSSLETAAGRIGSFWAEEFTAAGKDAGRFVRRATGSILIDFDTTNNFAVDAMQQNRLRLIREFTEQQRNATRVALTEGTRLGINPRDMARTFRDSIGLTAKQARSVENFRRLLSEDPRQALTRRLRDRRFDASIRGAIGRDQPIPGHLVDKMVARYRERLLKHRSEVIARTEALRSVHQGRDAMFRQAFESGALLPEQLIQIWNTAGDERVRDFSNGAQTSHATMNGQQAPVGGVFVSGAGNTTTMPGAFGVGYEDIMCRCVLSVRIATLADLRGALTGAAVIG